MWKIYFSYTNKNDVGITSFYLLPTIEYLRDRTFDEDGDCSFDISFCWLFWSLTFTRYWGSVYDREK